MEQKDYKIEIKASAAKVWFALWDIYHYRKWTSVFGPDAYPVTDNWAQGSRVHFLIPSGMGMFADVSENKPFEIMEFTHLGTVENFEEMPPDAETKLWSGIKERYVLTESDGITTIAVKVEVYEKWMDFFENAFPKGLQIVKEMAEDFFITVETKVQASMDKVWNNWINPDAITKWCTATETWHTPLAENDFRIGGQFKTRMEAKDGSMGFDFWGTYTAIETHQKIEYTMGDGRRVRISFADEADGIKITESFEAETENPFDMQRTGWQAILTNFKTYTEND